MLTPEYLLHVSEGAEQISAQLHTKILQRITSRILARQSRVDNYVLTAVDKWQIEVLMDAGYLRGDIAKEIAAATNLQKKEIEEAFADAGVRAWEYDSKVYEAAGISTTSLRQSPYAVRLMQRNYEATIGEWENFTRTTADAAQQLFISKMDGIYNEIASGSIGYTQAFAEAINDLASEGVRDIVYTRMKNGVLSVHTDTIEVATLRCVRTGISQMSAQIQTARMDEMGVDLVLVSSHMGARPTHQVWQGKIYSRSGSSRKYPDFVSSTGYGTGPGLCGWNCRHNFSPWFEGMENPFEHYDKEENLKAYNEQQNQRAMERAIRKTKREQQVLEQGVKDAQNDDTRAELSERLNSIRGRLTAQNKEYREYCKEHGLRPLPERLKIASARRNDRRNADAAFANNSDINAITVKDINKQSTEMLKSAYEYHRIRNATKSVPVSELGDGLGVIKANYGKLSAESAKAFNDTIGKLQSEYDTPLTQIRTMTKDEFMYAGSSFAFVQHDYTTDVATLVINPTKCKDIDVLSTRIKELSENGYCVKIADQYAKEYVATHEFAHTIINIEQPLKDKTNWVGANYDVIRKARKEVEEIYGEYLNDVKDLTNNAKDLELQAIMATNVEEAERIGSLAITAYDNLEAVKLSDYSLVNVDEFMAEAFTNEKIGIRSNKYGVRVLGVIDKYFKR